MTRLLLLAVVVMLTSCMPATKPAVEQGAVRIVRDEFGVPHVYANDLYGLYFGFGHAIAQDRLFQMEMARRSTQGQVAEVLGNAFVEYDRSTRTLFSPASIRQQIALLPEQDRAIFEGYAAGVNRWLEAIASNPATLMPKQFLDLDFAPRQWSAYDVVMVFVGTMNNRYGDFNTELENAAIATELKRLHGEEAGMQLFDLLNPRFTDSAPTTIPTQNWSRPAYDALVQPSNNTDLMMELKPGPKHAPPSGFSNVWLVGKGKARDAHAILVNGPQFGWFNPAYVYSIGLHGAGIDVVGNTPFGYPMIMFGHNQRITWGSTWGASDIVDLFAEQLIADRPDHYLYQGQPKPFDRRTEVIAVKGQDPVIFAALRSIHGPIIKMDKEASVAYAKKRSWDGIELDTMLAWLRATWTTDWPSWKAQAEKSAINVNLYFADDQGNIGYFHGGHFPRRAPGHDNRFPVSGDGTMDWQGRQAVNLANPHVLNPAGGFLANWNNKPAHGVMNPDFFFYSWSRADRVDNLHQALIEKSSVSPSQAWDILATSSYADVYAPYLLPLINRAVATVHDAQLSDANRMLQAWDQQSVDANGDGYYDQQATALFRRFVSALIQRSLADNLGQVYPYFGASGYPTAAVPTSAGTNLPAGLKAIVEAVEGRSNFDLFNGQSAAQVAIEALRDALANSKNPLLETASRPFLTRNFLGIPQAGESELLIAPIEQNRGTENNMIVMRPGNIEGWEVTPPGQSGFIAPDGRRSNHYQDQFDMYQQFERKRMWFYPADVNAHKQSEIILGY